MKFYEKEKYTAAAAKFEAQKIAFGPFVFQAAMALRNLGILAAIEKCGAEGVELNELAGKIKLSK